MDNINAERVIKHFKGLFPTALPKAVISVPGRTELGGNHTDHQGGRVLAGSVKMEMLAAASPINNNEVYLHIRDNRSHRVVIDISQKTPLNHERGLPASLVRGVAAGLSHMGYRSGGFEAYEVSRQYRLPPEPCGHLSMHTALRLLSFYDFIEL